jgi:phosphoenolpyruvate carboxykinase (ATP)
MVASRPGSPYTGGRPSSANSVHTKVEEDLHEFAGIDYDKVCLQSQLIKKNV